MAFLFQKGLSVSYIKAKVAYDGMKNLSVVAGIPSLDSLDVSDAKRILLQADMLYFGHGVTANMESAFRAYEVAAKLEEPRAQLILGKMLIFGEGTPKVESEGLKWIQQAATSYADAMNELGIMYAQGIVVKQDDVKAREWYIAAAEKEHVDAMTNLGYEYIMNDKQVQKGLEWLQRAADKNYAKAQNYLGSLYYHGAHVTCDTEKAVDLFRRSAQQVGACLNSNNK